MTDKQLQHELKSQLQRQASANTKDWKRGQECEEELAKISPVFRKIKAVPPAQPTSQEWRTFTQKLSDQLESTRIPLMRTLRDRITSSDSLLLRWFWIVLALMALGVLACIITLYSHTLPSLPQFTSLPTQTMPHIIVEAPRTRAPHQQA